MGHYQARPRVGLVLAPTGFVLPVYSVYAAYVPNFIGVLLQCRRHIVQCLRPSSCAAQTPKLTPFFSASQYSNGAWNAVTAADRDVTSWSYILSWTLIRLSFRLRQTLCTLAVVCTLSFKPSGKEKHISIEFRSTQEARLGDKFYHFHPNTWKSHLEDWKKKRETKIGEAIDRSFGVGSLADTPMD